TSNQTDLWKLGLGYDMPSGPVDGMKPAKVAEAMDEAIERARSGNGPTLLELKTYRYRGHSMSDPAKYRSKEEVEEYHKLDPILFEKHKILKKEGTSEEKQKKIEKKEKKYNKELAQYAEDSDWPDKSVMYDSVYEQEDYPFLPQIIKY